MVNEGSATPRWRPAHVEDDDAIVSMSLALYANGHPPVHLSPDVVRATLDTLREEPTRGRALVLDAGGERLGYAFLISFWSNELGGEICTIDELYVVPAWRSRGYATLLVRSLLDGGSLWPRTPAALELEVAPQNSGARALYERLGFRAKRNTTLRLQ
jgi:ribosomal protein S18 acetylase RimI-like enzyme